VAGRRRVPARRVLRLRVSGSEGFAGATLAPPEAHWDAALGEFILDWDDVCASANPYDDALAFARSAVKHGCTVCGWEPKLSASVEGNPPPVV